MKKMEKLPIFNQNRGKSPNFRRFLLAVFIVWKGFFFLEYSQTHFLGLFRP